MKDYAEALLSAILIVGLVIWIVKVLVEALR